MTRSRPLRHLRHDVHEQPFLVIWEVTQSCDLACAHCRADAGRARHPAELTTDEGRALLDDLATIGPPHPLVVLTGGDPFARPDLAELVAHGTAAGLHVALSPSVTPRVSREALAQLRAAGAPALSLSLDGEQAATHDGFRGIDGVFDETLAAARTARTARELGYRLQLNTTVTADNVHELPGVLRHVVELDTFLWSVFLLVPTGRGSHLTALAPDRVEDVLHWLVDVARHQAVKATEAPHFRRVVLERDAAGPDVDVAAAFGLGATYAGLRAALDELVVEQDLPVRVPRPPLDVNAGRGFVFVSHTGAVHPSGFMPLPCGSVRDAPLSELYRTSPVLQRLRDPDNLTGVCGRCDHREVCGGSRSRAYATTGDPFADDPSCLRVAAAV